MPRVEIRFPKTKDAKKLYEILSNPNFIYFNARPKSAAEEKEWIMTTSQKRKDNFEWNYVVTYAGLVVGAVGLKINQHRKYIGEIGYFIDEAYWGKGIASQAVKLVEKQGFNKLGLRRIEILMQPENKASEKVAVKNSYQKEGLLRKTVKAKDGKMKDAYIYAKVK